MNHAAEVKIAANSTSEGNRFGWSVAISGDTAIVGAYQDDDAGSNSGAAYIFVRDASNWTQQAKLTASDATADDRFGWAVAISSSELKVMVSPDGGMC